MSNWKYWVGFAFLVWLFVTMDNSLEEDGHVAESIPAGMSPTERLLVASLKAKFHSSQEVVRYLQALDQERMAKLINLFHVPGAELLTREGAFRFLFCHLQSTNTTQTVSSTPTEHCKLKQFRSDGKLIALASFPGSGNTWTRSLLEEVTGVYTGSIYQDVDLVSAGFEGECVMSRNVIVVKSHGTYNPGVLDRVSIKYDGAIYIIRNIYDALVSEYSRRITKSHVSALPASAFGENKHWDSWVRLGCNRWMNSIVNWLYVFKQPILVVQYEHLKMDLASQLVRMLDFLEYPYTQRDIDCVLRRQLVTFKRHRNRTFDPFTAAQKVVVRNSVQRVHRLLLKHNINYDIT